MDWEDVPDSELLRRLKAGALPHPTNSAFSEKTWRQALEGLEEKTDRDFQLAVSAVHFGREIQSIRLAMEGRLLDGLTRSRATRLLAALANQQHVTMLNKVNKSLRRTKKSEPLHFEQRDQHLFENSYGQQMTADDATAALVDSLPNWLHHISKIPDDAVYEPPDEVAGYGMRAMTIASVERGLRDLWQGALWMGDELGLDDETLVQRPGNPALEKLWLAWDMRTTSLTMWEASMDAGASIVTGGKIPPVTPVITRTVTRLGKRADGRRRFIVGKAKGYKAEQRLRVSERDMLERLYVGQFLDEPLPAFGNDEITCRDLIAAWWVLTDLARLIRNTLGNSVLPNEHEIGRFACSVEPSQLIEVLSQCLAVTEAKAGVIIGHFTCDPTDTKRLFQRGLWNHPLLPDPTQDRLYIVLAPLLVGSTVRRVERWLADGGISDDDGLKGRGKPYENFVRRELAKELEENAHIEDWAIAREGLKPKQNGEEIDLLIRVGSTVIVGEIKCFTSPSEPLERANYLRALDKATAQARRKLDWANKERARVAERLGITDAKTIAKLSFVGVVVTAQSFGIGLSRHDIPIVDFHFLRLVLASNNYQGDTRFEEDVGMMSSPVHLYEDQTDFETKIADLLTNPPPLQRYKSAIGWRRLPFATSNGSKLMLEVPELQDAPIEANTKLPGIREILTGPARKFGK